MKIAVMPRSVCLSVCLSALSLSQVCLSVCPQVFGGIEDQDKTTKGSSTTVAMNADVGEESAEGARAMVDSMFGESVPRSEASQDPRPKAQPKPKPMQAEGKAKAKPKPKAKGKTDEEIAADEADEKIKSVGTRT